MKILMIAWEYQLKKPEEGSNSVHCLSKKLKELGHEVHVLTNCKDEELLKDEAEGVSIHRVIPYTLPGEDFTKWVMHLNFAILEEGIKLINDLGKFDLIHCHDWIAMYAGKVLKTAYNIPIIATINATEHGRNGGIKNQFQHYISSAEWMLTYEAWKLITCSKAMKEEVMAIFNTPEDKIFVISNNTTLEESEVNNEGYTWDKVARNTELVYEKVIEEAKGTEWEIKAPMPKKRTTRAKKKVEEDTTNTAAQEKAKPEVKEAKDTSKLKRTRKKV